MEKQKKVERKLKENVIAEKYWILPSQIKLVKAEANKNWGNNKSALVRHMINSMFRK